MKAKLNGKIVSVVRSEQGAELTIDAAGQVDNAKSFGKEITLNGVMNIKPVIADNMKIGAIITMIISDEEPVETQ